LALAALLEHLPELQQTEQTLFFPARGSQRKLQLEAARAVTEARERLAMAALEVAARLSLAIHKRAAQALQVKEIMAAQVRLLGKATLLVVVVEREPLVRQPQPARAATAASA
jgi:hypothetical protein